LTGSVNLIAWYDLHLSPISWLTYKCFFKRCLSLRPYFFLLKLLIGTADGGIKAWNVDAKRVVCDLNTTEAFPRF